MDESTRTGPLAELSEIPVEITLHCACTKVTATPISYILQRLGPQATIAEVERRMKCQTCRQRPTVVLSWKWGSDPRRRQGPPIALPVWCRIG